MFYLQYANNSPNDLQWLLYCPCITFLQDKIWRLSEICRVQPDKIWLTSKTCFPPNWVLGLDIYQGPVSPMKLQLSFGGLLLNSWWPQTLSLRHQIAVPRFWSINEGPKSGSWGFSQALGGSSLLSRLALAPLILSLALHYVWNPPLLEIFLLFIVCSSSDNLFCTLGVLSMNVMQTQWFGCSFHV